MLESSSIDVTHEPFEALLMDDAGLLLNYLSISLRSAFADREIRLIKVLQAILGKPASQDDGGDTLSIYGVRKFEHVWEAMIKQVFGHEMSCEGESPEWQLPVPQWTPEGKETAHKPIRNRLIPDCVRLAENTLWVLDAKYYSITFDQSSLSGQPGVQDVVKQLCYEKAFESMGGPFEGKITRNCFLFPGHQQEETVYLGRVSMQCISGKGIDCFQLSLAILADAYLHGKIKSPEEIGECLNGEEKPAVRKKRVFPNRKTGLYPFKHTRKYKDGGYNDKAGR